MPSSRLRFKDQLSSKEQRRKLRQHIREEYLMPLILLADRLWCKANTIQMTLHRTKIISQTNLFSPLWVCRLTSDGILEDLLHMQRQVSLYLDRIERPYCPQAGTKWNRSSLLSFCCISEVNVSSYTTCYLNYSKAAAHLLGNIRGFLSYVSGLFSEFSIWMVLRSAVSTKVILAFPCLQADGSMVSKVKYVTTAYLQCRPPIWN
jgi:hypothetical protein